MTLLDRYIARSILSATGMVALVVGALVVLMLFIGETGHIGEGHYGITQVLIYMVLMVPTRMSLVLPVVSLLGALLALGALASGSELVVIRSAGVSMRRLALSVGLGGLVLALIAVALNEYLGPAGIRHANAVRDMARYGKVEASLSNGLWLHLGDTVLRVHATLPGGRILGLDLYRFGSKGQLTEALSARHAELKQHELVIEQPRFTRIATDHTTIGNPRQMTLGVDIDPKVLALAVTAPDELSSAGLWRYIDYLQRNDINASDYRLALWRNIVTPFEVWVLVVFALPFAFGSLRSASAGQRLFVGGLTGLVFFLVNEIVASAAPVYGVPPWLAASLPTVLLAIATGWWMRRLS